MNQPASYLVTLVLTVSALVAGCSREEGKPPAAEVVAVVEQVPTEPVAPDVEWRQHGFTAAEDRFSPLADINAGNVSKLGLAWYFDYPTSRGMEATPLVIDGVIYTTGSWSMVYANDALSGELLWFYDPQVPRDWAVHGCCDVVNRGVAYSGGNLYFGTFDGRLVSLDAADGSLNWEVRTTDPERPYTITGAPRIIKDKVIIGNGGAEFGVRGYVSAYNVNNGELAWRFYTVPGNPAEGFENEAMKRAAATWGGGEWWVVGGGGTVWDSMAYDPDLNLLYVGVGNGAPWNRQIRSPDGGDNLYVSSILALNPDDGSYVWHYQTTPGETWDYTATQHLILADLDIGGKQRQVIMQAPKNGFFYVLDRASGELLSATPYATVNWATHVDMETGRPVEVEGARYEKEATGLLLPGPYGAHNWHPMSYNPETGLVYIPAQDVPYVYETDTDFRHRPGYWNTGVDARPAALPDDPEVRATVEQSITGAVIAWDPVAATTRWRVEHVGPWNGGILSTAGDLVFQGNASGELVAYRYENGRELWSDALARTSISTQVGALTDVDADPIIDQGRVYALGQGGRMAAYELLTGTRIWELTLAGISTPTVAGEWVFTLTDEAQLLAIQRNTGRIRWVTQLERWRNPDNREGPIFWTGPVLASGRLWIASSRGYVKSVDVMTGQVSDFTRLDNPVSLAPVVANNTLYIMDNSGRIHAWR